MYEAEAATGVACAVLFVVAHCIFSRQWWRLRVTVNPGQAERTNLCVFGIATCTGSLPLCLEVWVPTGARPPIARTWEHRHARTYTSAHTQAQRHTDTHTHANTHTYTHKHTHIVHIHTCKHSIFFLCRLNLFVQLPRHVHQRRVAHLHHGHRAADLLGPGKYLPITAPPHDHTTSGAGAVVLGLGFVCVTHVCVCVRMCVCVCVSG